SGGSHYVEVGVVLCRRGGDSRRSRLYRHCGWRSGDREIPVRGLRDSVRGVPGAGLCRDQENDRLALPVERVARRASLRTGKRRTLRRYQQKGRVAMLHYAIVFFVIAIIAAVFGFTGIAAGAAEIAKILFYIFLVVFVVTLLLGVFRT